MSAWESSSGAGQEAPDRSVYRNELRLADLAEPLGSSRCGVEHHFTDYTMSRRPST